MNVVADSDLSSTLTMNGLLMAVVGFFIGGVANLVSAAISADLGEFERISSQPSDSFFLAMNIKPSNFSYNISTNRCRLKLWCYAILLLLIC